MKNKCALCLANGSIQFWTVDPKKRTVRIFSRNGSSQLYNTGQSIPLAEILGKGQLAVDDIFSSAIE